MADEDMEFRALGTVEVLSGGSRLSLGGPKQRGLLAMLLTNVGRVVPLDRIGECLWAERPPSPGTVYRLASRLRQVLWPPGAEPDPERSVLVGGDGGYRLVVDPEQVDVVRFEGLLRAGRARLTAGDAEDAFRTLREALAQWRGPALTGVPEPVRFGAGDRLEELRLVAFEEWAVAALLSGRHEDVLPDLVEHANSGPIRERAVGLLMTALQQSGRSSEALDLYRTVRERMLVEQAMEPGELLRIVHQRVLDGCAAVVTGDQVHPVPTVRPALARPGI